MCWCRCCWQHHRLATVMRINCPLLRFRFDAPTSKSCFEWFVEWSVVRTIVAFLFQRNFESEDFMFNASILNDLANMFKFTVSRRANLNMKMFFVLTATQWNIPLLVNLKHFTFILGSDWNSVVEDMPNDQGVVGSNRRMAFFFFFPIQIFFIKLFNVLNQIPQDDHSVLGKRELKWILGVLPALVNSKIKVANIAKLVRIIQRLVWNLND